MPNTLLDGIVLRDILREKFNPFTGPCRQRLLIVTDGGLDFSTAGFGLSRCIAALLAHSLQPMITLAHRSLPNHTAPIGGTTFNVIGNFNFDTAATAVTVANYDQIWMFGIMTGAAGPSPQPLTPAEIVRIATFMNAGGGVFSTGDHARLGEGMGGELPRIRHMRDWSSIPMGLEGQPIGANAVDPRNRIDTIVDPGAGAPGLYEFDDQSDSIPQRIYGRYPLKWNLNGTWTAGIHPLLSLGGVVNRTADVHFTNDMDVLPDHPHESVCLEVSTAVNPAALNGTYNANGLNFQEFPNAVAGGGRVGSDIVAYAVSGGRAIGGVGGKPPVYPRMFGVISAFDGHSAQVYPSAPTRPGRIVCDSTWHHFVNINIDGSGSGRSGLGGPSGPGWMPSAACNKILEYFRNILKYLTPFNRQSCWIYLDLIALRFHPLLLEEIIMLPELKDAAAIEEVGREAIRLIDSVHGPGATAEAVRNLLRQDPATAPLAEAAEDDAGQNSGLSGANSIVAYCVARALAEIREDMPLERPDELVKRLESHDHEEGERALVRTIGAAAAEALELQVLRADERLRQLSALARPERKAGDY